MADNCLPGSDAVGARGQRPDDEHEMERDEQAYCEAIAADDGVRISLDDLRSEVAW